MNDPKSKLEQELAHQEQHPHSPVKGCVSVMPIFEEGRITLQFNGFAIHLLEGIDESRNWVMEDTAKTASLEGMPETSQNPL